MAKTDFRAAIREAERFVKESFYEGVHTVYRGKKIKGGRDTGEEAVVFAVEKKRDVPASQMLPPVFLVPPAGDPNGPQIVIPTDVVECPRFEVQIDPKKRIRPAPGGVSYGHKDITAGTLGGWVRRPGDVDNWYALTNAHVGADTNDARFEDVNLQPGPADGGRNPFDVLGELFQRIHIHMGSSAPVGNPCEGGNGGKKEGKASARVAWAAWKAPANALARLVGCPYRLLVVDVEKRRHEVRDAFFRGAQADPDPSPFCLPQSWPNLVDACVVGPVADSAVNPEIAVVGRPLGLRRAELGDEVMKHGRTTAFTAGDVIGVDASSQVSYRDKGTGLFRDQIIIEGRGGDFSAGGDSGSWIVNENRDLVGLLFAGGGGVTIGNQMPNVFSLLGVTL